ncbi:DUF881 domain-containing protein [Actinoallomurus rhizosphaericola]|uniref:DUF881 domain-containing protein n=1 Tax=Actinoallomurus rhizosphaericola TaxID=2952536 RepID=UPI002092E4B4|nr:DUF881 domain-containing protein [Actinoallomurus rhizosphaericola]MCO5995208.1 DUF881 domain-containing protein [Actinoallomurus rhizosphaericola]
MTERGTRWNRPDASMSLLADLLAGKDLDPGYEAAAARRAASGDRRGRAGRWARLLAGTLIIGLLGAVAVVQVRRGEPVAQRQRRALLSQIEQRTGEDDGLQRQADRLRGQTDALRRAALARSDAGRTARREMDGLAAAAAAGPVHGPGLTVVLDDSRTRGDPQAGRVSDQDMQRLVNALWAAGATAVAVNGQRIAATTAIRFAGDAILVDYRPLSRPYTVTALGDPGALNGSFAGSPAARSFRTLKTAFGIRFDIHQEDSVRLPAAPAPTLRYAGEVPSK